MASGSEHYRRAEQLVENAWRHVRSDNAAPLLHSHEVRAALLATAQVHATLALASVRDAAGRSGDEG